MKKRLNILCVLVFVVVAMGFWPFVYAFTLGFQTGWESNDGAGTELDRMVNGSRVHLIVARTNDLGSGTIRNEVTGEEVCMWPERIVVDQPVDESAWFKVVNMVVHLMVYAALIVMVVLFLKLIVRVNRGQVFEWRNVKLLRWLGAIILTGSVVTTALQVYEAYEASKVFAVSGFRPDYFSFVSVMELTVGLVALIVAEIFAVGLKMKEEQDLTI